MSDVSNSCGSSSSKFAHHCAFAPERSHACATPAPRSSPAERLAGGADDSLCRVLLGFWVCLTFWSVSTGWLASGLSQ